MPFATIEVRRQYSREQEIGIIDAVHVAMMEGIKTPVRDKHIRLVVHEPHRFASPPDHGEKFTLICIDLFEGRSLNAKRALYQAIVRNLAPFGIPANEVKVLLREATRDNFGLRGGVPASDIDLGFEVKI